jgi:methylmalonic aciduria homocystinuria type C protein
MSVYTSLTSELGSRGLDVTQPFAAQWYNEATVDRGLARLPTFGHGATTCLLIGNTRELWNPFLQWYAANGTSTTDPIDDYCHEMVNVALGAAGGLPGYEVFWADDYNPATLISMQRVAEISGLCYLDHEAHLAIHPTYGSWVSFRAVVAFDAELPAALSSPPPPVARLLSDEESAECSRLLQEALEKTDWRRWVALRDAIKTGMEFRFSPDQIEYHYSGNREVLQRN